MGNRGSMANKKAVGIFLTLHGGSGTDDEDFLRAIAAGINIIYINTELRVAWAGRWKTVWPVSGPKLSPIRFCRRSWSPLSKS